MATPEHDGPDDDRDALDPDEPETPMWLPLLGIALFLVAALLFIATRGEDEQAEATEGGTAASAEPVEPAQAAEPAQGAAQPAH